MQQEKSVAEQEIRAFEQHLTQEEKCEGTKEKYLRDVYRFWTFLQGAPLCKERVTAWKEMLLKKGYCPTTVNSMLAAVNSFVTFLGRRDCRVKALRVQRRLFREPERELTREEYQRLLTQAEERLALVMETICATGIRVSEVQYITVEAARAGRADIALKGKIRTILLPSKLCRKLLKYAKRKKITSGKVFLTRGGQGLSRKQIWGEMKQLCKRARVAPTKVFPHNLRHLFARCFYRACRDVVKLADMLGHSSIETTRLYLVATGVEHQKQLEQLRLIR